MKTEFIITPNKYFNNYFPYYNNTEWEKLMYILIKKIEIIMIILIILILVFLMVY